MVRRKVGLCTAPFGQDGQDQVSLLLIAGHGTTVNPIGTGIRGLLRMSPRSERERPMNLRGLDE